MKTRYLTVLEACNAMIALGHSNCVFYWNDTAYTAFELGRIANSAAPFAKDIEVRYYKRSTFWSLLGIKKDKLVTGTLTSLVHLCASSCR